MNRERRDRLVTRFLAAWTSQDIERVLDCYTDDVRYHGPNTRGDIMGRDSLRRYLTRLLAGWQMTWAAREAFDLEGQDGVAFLWRANRHRRGRASPLRSAGDAWRLFRRRPGRGYSPRRRSRFAAHQPSRSLEYGRTNAR